LLYEKPLFPIAMSGAENNARIVSSGDTIAVVWEKFIGGAKNILFSYSVSGPSGLCQRIDTLSKTMMSDNCINPDVAYNHGKFYVVFGNQTTHQVYMIEGLLYLTASASTIQNQTISVNYNSTVNSIQVGNQFLNSIYSIISVDGHLIQRGILSADEIQLNNKPVTGIYFLKIDNGTTLYQTKLFISQK